MISSTRFHILWNGMPLSEVVSSRRVRQGDPLSSYLFILCLERLSLKLEEAVRDKLLHPISFCGRVRLSHLFFADDIFMFTHTKAKDCTKLCHILQEFCAASGQLVSIAKSRLWFSPNTPRHCKDQVTGILGVPIVNHIGTYLGTPVFTSWRITSSYQYLVDKIRMKIEGWQTKYLSMASRATLIKSAVSTIPIYAMQTTLLPQKISHQLVKMNSSFLWGDTGQHRSCHTVNWETVTIPKEVGGLGLTTIRHRNQAILMHQAWRLYTNPDTIWVRVLKAKYFPHSPMFDDTRRVHESHIWAAFRHGIKLLPEGMSWIVGDSQDIRIWKDPWLPHGTLRSYIEGPLQCLVEDSRVSSLRANHS